MILRALPYIFLFTTVFTNLSKSQEYLKELGWRSPVDIPILLSGNFAELRGGHFHAGIDIKTQGKVGFPIYAVQDGYVSRIKISPTGYGKAIYINHPDGHTSVYAHLREFNIQLEKYVLAEQYSKESFAIDLIMPDQKLKVSKGEIIGLSGNSGSSGGPHLHFEVRDTKTSKPLNGLFLGYDIEDTVHPKMYELYVYSRDNEELETYENRKTYSLRKKGSKYSVAQGDTLKVQANFGLGLKVNDYLNNSNNRCGVYQLKVMVNDELYFMNQFDDFSFSETRYINSLMDYHETKRIKRYLHKLFVDPNNQLSVYEEAHNNGLLKLNSITKIDIIAIDAYGNESKLGFYANPVLEDKFVGDNLNNTSKVAFDQAFEKDTLGIKISIPKNALYTDVLLSLDVEPADNLSYYSPIYHVHNKLTPIHKYYNLKLNHNCADPAMLSKLVILKKGDKGPSCFLGEVNALSISTRLREFGSFYVASDTLKPEIKPRGVLAAGETLSMHDTLMFTVSDSIAGVAEYRGTLNGNWVLFQWDPKTRRMFYYPDHNFPKSGKAMLELKVIDGVGNEAVFKKEYFVNPI